MINFVVTKTKGNELIVSEKKLSHHHSSTSLNLVHVEVQTLKVGAVLEGLSQVLGSLTLNGVAHQVQIEKSDRLADQVSEGTRTDITDLIVAKIDLLNMDGVTCESRADNDQVVV